MKLRGRRQRRRARAAERKAFLNALVAVAAAKGITATAVDDVVRHAGLDRAAFHRHFDDLEQCFLAAWEQVNECFVDALVRAFAAGDTWREGVRAAGRVAMNLLEQYPRESRVLFVEVLDAGPRARARLHDSAEVLARVLDTARDEMDHGEAPWRSTADAVIGSIYATMGRRLRQGSAPAVAVVPELVCVAVTAYHGVDAGLEELRLLQ